MKNSQRLWFVPPMWLTIIMLGTGIIGTDLVYHSFTNGTWLYGLLGLLLLLISVLVLGTPLAFIRYLKKTRYSTPKH